MRIHMRLSGEFALLLELVDETAASDSVVDVNNPARLQWLAKQCQQLCADALVDLVPAYQTLLLSFTPYHPRWPAIIDTLEQACQTWQPQLAAMSASQGRVIELPVCYEHAQALDLPSIAHSHGLTESQLIDVHCSDSYTVFAIGFMPAFAYLGFVPASIATPRRRTPRLKVPQGAVAIADRQTAVYPTESPGGWNIVGLCPYVLNSVAAQPWCEVGDRVQFQPISTALFTRLQGQPVPKGAL